MGDSTVLRFGILSTARIAGKFVAAAEHVETISIVAIASRSADRAAAWANEHGLEDAAIHGSYEDLINDPRINAVYIPLPTSMRPEWAVQAARENGVCIMDGAMFVHSKRHNLVKALSECNESKARAIADVPMDWNVQISPPTLVSTAFSFCNGDAFFGSNIRVNKELEPLGCLGDLGWYTVYFVDAVFGHELPLSVQCTAHRFEKGVPTHCIGTVAYANGRIATMDISFHHARRNWAEISSPSHTLALADFSTEVDPEGRVVVRGNTRDAPAQPWTLRAPPVQCQEVLLLQAFVRAVEEGRGGDLRVHAEETLLRVQAIVSAMYESANQGGCRVDVATAS